MKIIHTNSCLGILFFVAITSLHGPCLGQKSPQDYVTAHNVARAKVGEGPMLWDEKVAGYARSYVNQRAGDCNLLHSNTSSYGENLAEGSGSGDLMTGREAVDLRVKEKPNYNYGSNSCVGGECLHYTQVVWRNSVRLGCAMARCENGWWFISCNYDPPGNYIGERPY